MVRMDQKWLETVEKETQNQREEGGGESVGSGFFGGVRGGVVHILFRRRLNRSTTVA